MALSGFEAKAMEFSVANAKWCAEASLHSYENGIDSLVTETWGCQRFEAFSREDTQGFVMGSVDVIVVAFRGTEIDRKRDWLSDGDCVLTRAGVWGLVHRGFARALDCVWPTVTQLVSDYRDNGQTIWYTGHSLGGALAVLAAARSMMNGQNVWGVYTFGQPRVGDVDFVNGFEQLAGNRLFRFVNNNDIVPRVPPRALGYGDVGVLRYFNAAGALDGNDSVIARFLDQWVGRIENTQHALDRFLELRELSGPDAIEDHRMECYCTNVQKLNS